MSKCIIFWGTLSPQIPYWGFAPGPSFVVTWFACGI